MKHLKRAIEVSALLLKHGEGCRCAAWSSFECGCSNAVWGDNYTNEASEIIRNLVCEIESLQEEMKVSK